MSSSALQRKLQFKKYAAQVKMLTGVDVALSDLLSVEETHRIRAEIGPKFLSLPTDERTLLFSDLQSQRFQSLIVDLESLNSHKVSIWTNAAVHSGVFLAGRIGTLQFDFLFAEAEEEVFSFLTEEYDDRLTINFIDTGVDRLVKVSMQGKSWFGAGTAHLI